MGDFPDPEEEYELMYADELEMLREEEERDEGNPVRKGPLPAKRSLDFSSPVLKKAPDRSRQQNIVNEVPDSQISLTPALQPMEDVLTSNASSKRTAEDLFGDIGDIDFNDIELPSKRQKTEEETDLELIEKIIEGRKLRQMLLEPTNKSAGNVQAAYDAKENLSVNIPRWAFLPLTKADGERIYVRLESEESWERSLEVTADQPSIRAAYASAWDEARKILEAKQQAAIAADIEESPLPDMDSVRDCGTLWVDKYRPESYLDLLSEEPVNRALLHWLHLWDKIVFKKEVKMKEPQQRSSFNKRAGQFQLSNKWRGKKENEPEMDEDGRPRHKVALLCGPPGVGKTTLAHLLARLAGYRPVELNASDERSTEAFRTALQSATLMKSVLDKDRRPNCLILDEIDGAPLPTVELLVKWCTASASEGKKKKPTAQPLRRPVIAICNDLYATSLRPLRPVSLIIQVGGISIPRLVSRLSLVCSLEGVTIAPHVLSALAARAQGDVRAAIQVLSFIKARAKAQVSMEDVKNAAIGTKDHTRSMMQSLQKVFTIDDKDPDSVLRTIQAAGEYDRLIDGIFENYLTARVDARLLIASETLSWLAFYDTVNSWTMRLQNYSLYGLLPLCALRCHKLLASRAPHKVKFPTQALEMSRKKAELESIVQSVWSGRAPCVLTSRRALLMDILPLLPHLLCPTLRSANVQLCSESERVSLRTCAGAMCEYGLQYVQQRTQDGVYAFQLEPDIHRVALFGNEDRARPPPAIRQAIAREQQLEMIRRTEEMASKVPQKKPSDACKMTKPASTNMFSKDTPESRLPNHLQRLKPKELQKTTPQVHKDFFGRIVPLSQVQRADAIPDVIKSSSVFYQYQEGFNNAVRRNVRTKDIL